MACGLPGRRSLRQQMLPPIQGVPTFSSDWLSPISRGLSNEGATRWMGVRPSFPDALPAIGRASRHHNLFYSFGHQHVGLTQAAASARLLTDIIHGRPSLLDPCPFNL